MAKLKDKVQNALDETRLMALGVQVLIGFGFRAGFESTMAGLPRPAVQAGLVSLVLLCVTLALLLTPSANHRLCEHGQDSSQFHALTTLFAGLALLPFGVGLALDVAVASWRVHHSALAATGVGIAVAVVVLTSWYGIVIFRRPEANVPDPPETTPVTEKIKHVLTEARTVLPGAQAMLGFQLAVIFMQGFDSLPASLKWIHLASLSMTLLAVALLIMPAAWHRLVERGEETERFHQLASVMVVSALVPLGLGVVGDLYVVTAHLTQSSAVAVAVAGSVGLVFAGLWFGLSLWRRGAAAAR